MEWTTLAALAGMALVGGGHCAGMCGGLALAVTGWRHGPGRLGRLVAYLVGKTLAYFALGVGFLLLGRGVRAQVALEPFLTGLGWVVGGALIAVGWSYWRGGRGWGAVGTCGQRWLWGAGPTWWRSGLLGWANGWLPCGLSWSAVAVAAQSGSVGATAGGVVAFGLSTAPALGVALWLGDKLSASARRRWVKAGAVGLMALGVLTVLRTQPWFWEWMHAWVGWTGPNPLASPWCQ